MSTIKLYDKDAYETEFEATVVACACVSEEGLCKKYVDDGEGAVTEEKETVLYEVVLDETLFFPEEGGQSPDKGRLGDATVLDVQIKDDVIIHTLDKPLAEGKTVIGKIDWKHRFSNMQQHSGEHIFSGFVYKKYGYQNVGFHLSDQIVTMDFDGPLTKQQVEELEWEVNETIVANVVVKTGYPSKEELQQMEYRSKKEIDGDIRIVEIEGYDRCACCAPHVSRTGEIGGFKVQTVQNYKGGVRISFLCGFRALEEYRRKAQIISELSAILTTNQELLAENVDKMKSRQQSLQMQLKDAKQTLMEMKIEQIPEEQKDVVLFEEGLESPVMRNVVNKLVERHDGICAVFVGEIKTGYNFIIGGRDIDCREIAGILKDKLGARGGGSSAMIQGSVKASEDEIREVLRGLES